MKIGLFSILTFLIILGTHWASNRDHLGAYKSSKRGVSRNLALKQRIFPHRSLSYLLCPSSNRNPLAYQAKDIQKCGACSGILLDNQTILTAGHCSKKIDKNSDDYTLFIRLPAKLTYQSHRPLHGTFSVASTVHTSPEYIAKGSPEGLKHLPLNDLMIIKLEEYAIQLDHSVLPLHLTDINNTHDLTVLVNEDGAEFWSEGFGKETQWGNDRPYHMKKVQLVKQITVTRQRTPSGRKGVIIMFHQAGEHATCSGHSGSPGFYRNPITKQVELISIVSGKLPKSLDNKRLCNVHDEVSAHTWLGPKHRDWIRSMME